MSRKRSLNTTAEKTASQSPESSPPNQSISSTDDDDYRYGCPYCDVSYDHELLTRVHITRSEDFEHLNYNGFMPETEIKVINANDEIIETISRRPEEIDMSELTISSFPESLSEKHRLILLVASLNKDDQTYTSLEDKVATRFEKHELDCPSYATIRRVIRRFYCPQIAKENNKSEREDEPETLSSFTPMQQAIIIARLNSPDASIKQISDQIGCAKSYPGQIYDQAESIITDLEAKIERGDDVASVIRNELTADEIRMLIERDFLSNVPVNFKNLGESNSDQKSSNWGSPIKDHDVMSANPHASDNEHDQTDDKNIINQTQLSENDDVEQPVNKSATTVSSDQTISRKEIHHLREKVEFARQILEGSHGTEESVSLAKHIEEQLRIILQETAESET